MSRNGTTRAWRRVQPCIGPLTATNGDETDEPRTFSFQDLGHTALAGSLAELLVPNKWKRSYYFV